MPSGETVQFSTPELVPVPTYLDAASPEILAWYEKNGPFLVTWLADEQAECSRRYEGGTLHMALAGELSFAEAKALALTSASELLGLDGELTCAYPSFYAENARIGEAACYVICCSQLPETDTLTEAGLPVTFSTTGENVSLTAADGEALAN